MSEFQGVMNSKRQHIVHISNSLCGDATCWSVSLNRKYPYEELESESMKELTLENLKADGACKKGIEWIAPLLGNRELYKLKLATEKPDYFWWAIDRDYDCLPACSPKHLMEADAKRHEACAKRQEAYAKWEETCAKRHEADTKWEEACALWEEAYAKREEAYDKWQEAYAKWREAYAKWQETYVKWLEAYNRALPIFKKALAQLEHI